MIVVRGDEERVISSNAEDYAYNRRYEAASKRMAQEEGSARAVLHLVGRGKGGSRIVGARGQRCPARPSRISRRKRRRKSPWLTPSNRREIIEKLANLPCYFYFETAEWYENINPAKTIWRVDINISHGYDEGMVEYLSVIMDSRSGEILEYWDSRVSNGLTPCRPASASLRRGAGQIAYFPQKR